VNALLGRARDLGEPLGSIAGVGRPGIVHRLDKDTSGLLLVAKTDAAQASLMRQFGDRSIEKEYLALVRGDAPASRGRIEAPVGRDPRDRQRMAVVAGGREAVTEYESLGAGGGYTLLSLHPRTGRTHQLRAHLSYLGLPIAELPHQAGLRGIGLGYQEQARRVFVQPMHDPRPAHAGDRAERLSQVARTAQQRVHQGARGMTGAGVHHQAGWLVDEQDPLVRIGQPEWNRLRQQGLVRWGGELHADALAAAQPVAGAAAATVDQRSSIRDEPLGMRPADGGHAADRNIEASGGRHAVHRAEGGRGGVAHALASPRGRSRNVR
jgi:hypothetical protein